MFSFSYVDITTPRSFWKPDVDAVGSGLTVSHYVAELLGLKLDTSGTVQVPVFWNILMLVQTYAKGGYMFYGSQITLAIRQHRELCSSANKDNINAVSSFADEIHFYKVHHRIN